VKNKPFSNIFKIQHAGILFVAILLISTSLVSSTIMKFGSDGDGVTWSSTYGDTADYVVYKEGSTYYSKNSSTGQIQSSSNATTIIQNCIDAIETENNGLGGMIFIREGNYSIDYNIVPTANITIIGVGKGSVLYASNNVNIIYYQGGVFPDDRGFHVDKICFKSSQSTHTSAAGIKLDRVHHFSITECWFENLFEGIYLFANVGDVDNGWIKGNHFYKIFNHCIRGTSSCEENVIVENIIDNYGGVRGISYSGSHSTISCNTIEEVWGTGVGSGVGDGMYITGSENTVTGNTIRECGRYNLVAAGTNNVYNANIITDGHGTDRAVSFEGSGHVFSYNMIVDNDGIGMCCISGSNFTLAGNRVLNNKQGILLTTADDVIVSNNIIADSTTGVGLSGTGERVVIEGNNIRGNQLEGMYVGFQNSTICNNVISSNGAEGIQTTTAAKYLTIYDNILYDNDEGIDNYGTYSIIRGNDLRQETTKFTEHGNYSTIFENNGYVTENGGANTSTDDGGTITHGLSSTPTYVVCTCNESAIVAVTAKDGTDFTVSIKDHAGNAVNGVTIFWRAFYEP